MSPLLLVLLGLADWAVFWSGTHTYLVDAKAEQMYAAPGWYASDSQGQVWRYRIGVGTHRHPKGLEGEIWPASRWTVLEQAPVTGKTFKAMTAVPQTPPPGAGHLQDEVAITQFLGDAATLTQTARRYEAGGVTTTTEAFTLQLPSGAREQTMAGGTEAVEWLGGRLPGFLDRCLRRPIGLISQEKPGGKLTRQLVLGAHRDRCAGEVRVLGLGEVMETGGGMAWWTSESRDLQVIDARPNADLNTALLLTGPPEDEAATLQPPACATREVRLWKSTGDVKTLGPALALDGARWVDANDPLLALVRTHFLRMDRPDCTQPMRLHSGSDPRLPAPRAHLCRIDEDERAWGGPDDLAGAAVAKLDGERLVIDVAVHDPERGKEDGVHVWLGGDKRRAVHFKVRAGGVGVWGNRKTRQRIKRLVNHSWRADRTGYTTRIEVPRSLAGKTPSIAIKIEDRDPNVDGQVGLWVGGHRVTAYQRRPIACEVRR
jgi:hypothetical protein